MTSTDPALPSFYDSVNAASWSYRPDIRGLQTLSVDWRQQNGIKAASTDRKNVTLLLIDVQKDFCHSEGALFVGGRSGTGAMDDSDRLVQFIYRNLGILTHIRVTLDTHFPYQIFSPSFWLTKDGSHVAPFTQITAAQIRSGDYRPNPAVAGFLVKGNLSWLQKQVVYYAEQLERSGKYALMIWPEHCLLGDDGHNLVGVVSEARLFHAYVRGIQNDAEVKGGHPLTENFSVLSPEVLTYFDGKPMAQKNVRFIEILMSSDYLIIAGQAASHCVAWTVNDFLSEIKAKDPDLASKIFFMTDCTSAVTIPDGQGGFIADFTPEVDKLTREWAQAGVNLVTSTTSIETWPGFVL